MSRTAWIVLGVVAAVVVVAAIVAAPRLATSYARNATINKCTKLRADIAAAGTAGLSGPAVAELQRQLADCTQEANTYGANLDLGLSTLIGCDSIYTAIETQWTHYRATADTEAVMRNNTRQSILSYAQTLASCYTQAVADASTPAALDTIRQSILRSLNAAIQRSGCWKNGGAGCSRFGFNEDHPADMATQNDQRAVDPLRAVIVGLDAKALTLKNVPPNPLPAVV